MAHLVIETRDGVRRVELDRERLSIGRLAYNDVVLPFAQISRQHAELRRINGQWWVADLHSTNGLHFNERRIREHALHSGDSLLLAPGVTLLFVDEDSTSRAANGGPTDPTGAPGRALPRPPAVKTQPARPTTPPPPAPRPPSPFADGEVPYVPPGMASSQPSSPSVGRTGPAMSPAASAPFSPRGVSVPSGTLAPRVPSPPLGNDGASSGYPVPNGPLDGGGSADPYRRGAPAGENATENSGHPSNLLHVCQTCGQLTAPDAILCQNCRQPIARECPICGLNLLPVLDRCPRCHTPNHAYVGRAHQGRSSS
jgi:hypothetical protein